MNRDILGVPPDGDESRSSALSRKVMVGLIVAGLLVAPAIHLLRWPLTWQVVCEVVGAVLLATLFMWRIFGPSNRVGSAPWPTLVVICGLAIGLFAIGGQGWLGALAIAAAAWARYSNTSAIAAAGVIVITISGLGITLADHKQWSDIVPLLLIMSLAGMFAFGAARRADTLDTLRRTRAELARAAVAEERLRIARDLHDLLGHSLSLITLKAELAGRLMAADPDRAEREIAELEQVARRSLSDVRDAVAGFRQPDLVAELASAQQLIDAAGMSSRIWASQMLDLAQEADSALAWAVREGATNIVRHSRATKVTITVTAAGKVAVAEITDNGPPIAAVNGSAGGSALPGAGVLSRGSGLAGLTERVHGLGGEITAGTVQPHGFRLRVVVPIEPSAP